MGARGNGRRMSDLDEFLTARYDEAEDLARHAARDASAETALGDGARNWRAISEGIYSAPRGWEFARTRTMAIRAAEHIAAHDPARVLADIAAKRGLLALWQKVKGGTYSPDANQVAADMLEQLLAPYGKRAVWTREAGWRIDD